MVDDLLTDYLCFHERGLLGHWIARILKVILVFLIEMMRILTLMVMLNWVKSGFILVIYLILVSLYHFRSSITLCMASLILLK